MLGAGKSTVEIIIAAKDRTKAAFAKVNAQMTTMKGGAGRLGGAMNTLKGGISSATSSLGSLGAALGPLGIAVAAAAVVMATLGGAAIKASLEFEKAFATIRVGTGATGEALAGLEGSFKTVFTSVPASTADAATAIADLNTRLGLTGEPLEALATQFLNLSRITGTDVAASISSATRVMHDFDVSAQEQAGALDYLFKVSQSTGLGMTQLGNSMTQYGSVMRQMGFDINESAALLGKFEKEGVNLQLVLGSLRMGLANFAKAGEEPVEALQRVITEIQGMGSVADANMKAIEIFGSRAGPDMAAAIREGRFSITELMSTLDASSETINKAAADTLQFGDKWTLVKNNVMAAIAPIGDVITNVLGGAMEVAINAFALAKENIAKFKSAVDPLVSLIKDFFDKLSGGHSIIQNLKDVVTVLWAGLKFLGDAIIWLIKNAISIFVKYIREAIKDLTDFYNKLGPLKTLIEGVKGAVDKGVDGFHNYAESFREVEKEADNLMDRLDATIEELEGVKNKAVEVPVAIIKEWRLAVDAFEDGTGSYKDAIGAIDTEIEKLTALWKRSSEEEKGLYEDWIRDLIKRKEAMVEADKTATETLNRNIGLTEKAIEKTKDFIVTIGDTTIEFKGAAAEVLKNADAYEKLQKSAQTLIDLDWSVFTEFEASLPRIDAGLGDMESSFVGLKTVLEDNIEELENVKQSVIDISEIAAPFLEAGFLDGIKAIGDFASALKDASSAIGDFSSLQDVSIEGCINFSVHVRDMVTALQILESQMEDLVPAFGNMDSLITDIADAFLYGGDKVAGFTSDFDRMMKASYGIMEEAGVPFNDFKNLVDSAFDTGSFEYWYEDLFLETQKVDNLTDAIKWMDMAITSSNDSMGEFKTTSEAWEDIDFRYTFEQKVADPLIQWAKNNYNVRISMEEVYELMKKPPKEQKAWLDELMHSEEALTFQMDKQTNALKAQTGQLSKITEALQPYLEFMRTLNELAALSTLSTEELNNGLNSIKDTLVNLGTALSSFDLRSAMESLFGVKVEAEDEFGSAFTGGAATGFMDVMKDYEWQFNILIGYVTRLSSAITGLVSAFDALAGISDSVLADQIKLRKVFEDIVQVMSNFSTEMGTAGFADAIAKGMDAMLTSAGPLISYFEDNNASVLKFNNTLGIFKMTIMNVVDTMDMLKKMSKMVVPGVDELSAGFDRAKEFVDAFDESLMDHIGLTRGDKAFTYDTKNGLTQSYEDNVYNIEKMFDNLFTTIMRFADEWVRIDEVMGDSFEIFDDGVATITGLIGGIGSLVAAFTTLKDIALPSSTDMEAAFIKIRDGIAAVTEALDSPVWTEITTNLGLFKTKWDEISEGVGESLESFSDVITIFANIVDATKRLTDTFTDMEEIVVLTADQIETAFEDIPANIDAVTEYLTRKSFADLKSALKEVNTEWQKYAAEMGKSMESFNAAIDTFSTLISKVLSLSTALKELKDMSVLSLHDIDEAMKKIPLFLDNFVDALALNMYAIKESLKDLDTEWSKHAEAMRDTMPAYEDSTSQIGKLVGSLLSLNSALKQLAEMGTISGAEFDAGFKSLMESISNFAVSLAKNVDGLVESLQHLDRVWIANQDTLVPLMRDFMTITKNFYEIANNANAMADAFRDLQKNSGTLEKGFKSLIDFINQVVKSTKEFYTTEAAAELATFIKDVNKVIDAFVDLERDLADAMGKIKGAISTAVNNIEGKISSLSSLIKSAYEWGANMMGAFIVGMDSMSEQLAAAAIRQAGIVEDYLGASSPTKAGPLSHLDEWPRNLVQSYSGGIEAEMHTLNHSFAALAPNMGAACPASSTKSVTINLTQNIGNRSDADYSVAQLRREMIRHEVM